MTIKIYVELDALLDTRIALVDSIAPEAAIKMLSKDYWERTVDNFSSFGVDHSEYLEAYSNRTVDALRRSKLTSIAPIVNEIVMEIERDATKSPTSSDMEIHVNTYPYILSELELDTLKVAVSAYLGLNSKVKLMHLSPNSLTPGLVKERYSALFMYNFEEWLLTHGETIFNNRMPTVIFVAPALYLERPPTEGELKDSEIPDVTPFATMEHFMIETMALHLVNVRHFSIIEP